MPGADWRRVMMASVCAVGAASAVRAQQANMPNPTSEARAQATAPGSTAAADQQSGAVAAHAADAAPSTGVAEVIVTAQKRSENVQKTPAAVTALTGVSLVQAGLTDLRAVQAVVPAARFQQEGNSTQVFLRGIGSNLDYGNIEQSVSFTFNGVFIPREGTSVPLFDVERLEVLPGPQGTLYGRSAIGGTVNVAFQRPTQEAQTVGELEVGDYDLAHISLAQNMPLTSDLAVRAAIDYTYRDGYMSDGSDSQNDIAGRLSLLYTPSSNVKILVWGSAVNKAGSPANLVNKGYNPATDGYDETAFLHNDPYDTSRTGALAGFAPFGQPVAPTQIYHNFIGGAQIDVALGHNMTLTYIPSYLYVNSVDHDYWLGGIPATQYQHYHQVTQELRLAGDSDKLHWLLGLYGYQSINGGGAQVLINTPLVFYSSHILRNQLEGLAAFGQGTYNVTDRLRLTFGGRYSADNRSGSGISLLDGITPYIANHTYYHLDYKVGGEYDIAPAVMGYVTYQTGYQPGTYNEIPATPTQTNLVEAETISSISGGIKTRFFGNRLQINDEAFYYDYTNFFLQAYDASKAFNQIFNAKEVTIPGNQLDVIFKPTPDDQFTANVAYTFARDANFITPTGQNFDGFSPPYASDWTAAGSYAHDFHFSSGRIHVEADARYESPYFADYVHNLGTKQNAYVKENAAITYYPDGARWTLGLWVKNISNEAGSAATAAAGIPGPATAYLEAPRTFGARATVHY